MISWGRSNGFHETIKFTKDGDFERRTRNFLDLTIKIEEEGKLTTDLFVKANSSTDLLIT